MTLARSENGYRANDRTLIRSYPIPGEPGRYIALRKGNVSRVLLDFAWRFNGVIEKLAQKTLDEWGYAERLIRGSSTTISNHASGTAEDLNAQQHPLGVAGTYTARQRRTLRRLLRLYVASSGRCVLRLGEFYHGRVDGMHVEINPDCTRADVAEIADRIRTGTLGSTYLARKHRPTTTSASNPYTRPTANLKQGDDGAPVRWVQWSLGIHVDGDFGPRTDQAVREFQAHHGLTVDGIVGRKTRRELAKIRPRTTS